MTALDVLGRVDELTDEDGLLHGRRHGGGNRSISQIPVEAIPGGALVFVDDELSAGPTSEGRLKKIVSTMSERARWEYRLCHSRSYVRNCG